MSGKWMLFIPFFRSAYIGSIACVSAEEQGLKADNYSVWAVCLDVAFAVFLWLSLMKPDMIVYSLLGSAVFFRWLIGYMSSFYMLKLNTKHPGFLSLLYAFPFVLFRQSLKLEI